MDSCISEMQRLRESLVCAVHFRSALTQESKMFIDEAALAAARRGVPDGAFHGK